MCLFPDKFSVCERESMHMYALTCWLRQLSPIQNVFWSLQVADT